MAEGRNHFVCGWKAVGLIFAFLTSYYSLVEGASAYAIYKSDITVLMEVAEGEKALIPCKINANIDDVTWFVPWAGPYPQGYVVGLDLTVTPPVRFGPGYVDGSFNITDDFSLVINDVKPEYENLFYCNMNVYSQKLMFQNGTFVNVINKGLSTVAAKTTPRTECPTVGFSTVTAAFSTETTPKTKCPADDVFMILFGISVAALAVSWILMLCALRYNKRQPSINDFRPLAQAT